MPSVSNYPARLDLRIYPGATFGFPATRRAGGQPVDLTGAAARLHATDRTGDTVYDLTTAGGGITIPDPPNGRLVVAFPVAVPAAAAPISYVLSVTYAAGDVEAWTGGTITIASGPAAGGGA